MWRLIKEPEKAKEPEQEEPEKQEAGMSKAERFNYWTKIIREAQKVYALAKKRGISGIYFVRGEKP